MRFNRSEQFQPIGPRFTQVESPHIMLASRPLDAASVAPEEAIIISERDGTLISYYEEWDGKQYGITLEMLDPDGLFISKMFSMYIENMRTYFANVKDSVDTVGRSEQIRTLYNKHKLSLQNGARTANQGEPAMAHMFRLGEMTLVEQGAQFLAALSRFIDGPSETSEQVKSALSEEDKADLSRMALKYAMAEYVKEDSNGDREDLQRLLEGAGLGSEIYLNLGYGHQKYGNYSGFKKVHVVKLNLNQNTNNEYKITLKLVPVPSAAVDSVFESGKAPNQTPSEANGVSYFPSSLTPKAMRKNIILGADYSNAGRYVPLNLLKIAPEETYIDNTKKIVSVIETLLENYIKDGDDRIQPVVVLNPALEHAIRKVMGTNDASRGEGLHRLNRQLRKCGLTILGNQARESTGIRETLNSVFLQILGSPLVSRISYYEFKMFVEVQEGVDKIKRVKQIIDNIYKVFNVQPNGVTYASVSNATRLRDVYEQLYKKTSDGKYYIRGINENQLNTEPSFRDTPADSAILRAARPDLYDAEPSARVIPALNPPNALFIGDKFFIEQILNPKDPVFALQQYEGYQEYINKVMGLALDKFSVDESNMVRFIKGSKGQGLESYLKKYSQTSDTLVVRPAIQNSLIPDEFATRFTNDQKYLILKNTLIFIAGSENSNVFSITSKEDAYAFADFQAFFNINQEVGIKTAQEYVLQGYNSKNEKFDLSEEAIEKIIDDTLKNVYAESGVVRVLEEVLNSNIEDTDAVKSLRKMYSSIIDEIKQSPVVTNKSIDPKAMTNYLSYLDTLSQRTRTLVLKVSPSFFIDESSIGGAAFFFNSNPFMTSMRGPFSTLSILNGLYKIIGYKHTVSKGQCHTEVVLLRNVFSEIVDLGASVGED